MIPSLVGALVAFLLYLLFGIAIEKAALWALAYLVGALVGYYVTMRFLSRG